MSSSVDRRPMSAYEAIIVIFKFKDLWHSGHKANLYLETEAGQAWVTIKVCLGSYPSHHQKHVKPSQERHRERRETARAAEGAANAEDISSCTLSAEAIVVEKFDKET